MKGTCLSKMIQIRTTNLLKCFFLEDGKSNRILKTEFIEKSKKSFSNTFYSIKNRLIREFNHLPTPATFIISSALKLPKGAILLPVAKRLFLRKLANNSL